MFAAVVRYVLLIKTQSAISATVISGFILKKIKKEVHKIKANLPKKLMLTSDNTTS